jgi:YHS domain-containing protein
MASLLVGYMTTAMRPPRASPSRKIHGASRDHYAPAEALAALLAPQGSKLSFDSMVTDPVCGMEIEESHAPATTEYEGRVYSFCSAACRAEFEANPQMFAVAIDARPAM